MEIGIIGAGWWAAQTYIPLLQAHRDVTDIAVCRPDEAGLDSIRKSLGVAHTFTDASAMLSERPLAGAIVASPHVLHAEHAGLCIARGLPVLVEKPMTTTSADASALVSAAVKAGVPLVVGYGWNFRPIAAAARRLVAEGRIGELLHASCITATATTELFSGAPPPPTKDHLFRPPASTWADPTRAGGYGWGQLTHALGLFFLLVDRAPTGVFARMGLSKAGVDLCEAAVMELEGGATVAISGTATYVRGRKKQVDIRLHGTEGILLLDLERERLEVARFDGWSCTEALVDGDGQYGVAELLDAFVDLCAGRPVVNMADAQIGRRAVDALDAMYRSAASGAFEAV